MEELSIRSGAARWAAAGAVAPRVTAFGKAKPTPTGVPSRARRQSFLRQPKPRGALMSRRRSSPGGVVERQTARGNRTRCRFRAFGQRQYVHVGYAPEVTRADAERELRTWSSRSGEASGSRPPRSSRRARCRRSTSSRAEWYARREDAGLRPRTLEHLRWALTDHLLPTFRAFPLDRIDAEAIDSFTARKRRAGLSATSCNRLVQVLAAVLEDAVEYRLIDRNPAAAKRRRLKAGKPRRTYLDRADHIAALIEAGGELDRERSTLPYRRALLATLVLAGLRISEALALALARRGARDRPDLVCRAPRPTRRADRTVDLLPLLRDELADTRGGAPRRRPGRARVRDEQRARGTAARTSDSGCSRRRCSARTRTSSAPASSRCPKRLTHHALRRTFASVLYALGRDPGHRHGRDGPRRRGARAADLPSGDAPRRGRESTAGGARQRLLSGANGH